MLLIPQFKAIPYHANSAPVFEALRHLPYPAWLDSGYPGNTYGRFDILCADPTLVLTTHGSTTRIEKAGQPAQESNKDPFKLLADALPEPAQPIPGLPFCGGALGYFGYDLGRRLERLPSLAVQDIDQPDMQVGIYPWAVIQDHRESQSWLVGLPGVDLDAICQKIGFHDLNPILEKTEKVFIINKFKNELNADKYATQIDRIHDYIHAGDCYQVNFAQRFSADYQGDPYTAYQALRQALPSPFSGYIPLEQGAILSLSPERFIQVRERRAETLPIKGTSPRAQDPETDKANAERLLASAKDRAENLMIVDLLRNDFSKHCDQVNVPKLFALQSFTNVHHLVSTVTGTLKPDSSPLDLLAGSFPGGSITGAPKVRAMEIIEELEPHRRSVYCGSLGYISADGQMDTNIAIRTLVCDHNRIYCWGGGGIVADSDTQLEYEESLAKVELLMRTLEQKFSG